MSCDSDGGIAEATCHGQEVSSTPMYEESSNGGDAASDDSLELIEYYQVGFMDLACIFSVLLATKI